MPDLGILDLGDAGFGDAGVAQSQLSWHNAATGSGLLVLHGLCWGNAFPGKVRMLFVQQKISNSKGETIEPPSPV